MILKGEFGWGIAEGKIWRLSPMSFPFGESKTTRTRSRGNDLEALEGALARLLNELKKEKRHLKKGKEFLDFPLSVLQDPQLWNSVREFLNQGLAASRAVDKAFRKWEAAFKKIDDSYLRLRIQDLEDLRHRLLTLLAEPAPETAPNEPFIAIGKDLYVTDLLRLQHRPLQGVALEEGNESAHGVMLAKALGVPLAGKVKGLLTKAREGELAILSRDKVYIHEKPKGSGRLFALGGGKPNKPKEFSTKEGTRIAIRANLQLPEEIGIAKAAGAMGVGLFRTEFLWMKKPLSVKEESRIYRETLEAFDPDPVVFRLADFGSDKPYGKISWPEEKNPALGWRGLRFLLDRPEILSKQLAALFDAAGKRALYILFPMVRTPEEIHAILETLKPLQRKYKIKAKLGIMVETPASVDLLDRLPREVSFVSLGTNDLLQYFFAIDRLHPKVKADPLHPAFLRLLDTILRKCRRAGKSISVCGEMAAHPKALRILIGLGLRDFSVSISGIHEVARALARLSARECRKSALQRLKD